MNLLAIILLSFMAFSEGTGNKLELNEDAVKVSSEVEKSDKNSKDELVRVEWDAARELVKKGLILDVIAHQKKNFPNCKNLRQRKPKGCFIYNIKAFKNPKSGEYFYKYLMMVDNKSQVKILPANK